MTNIHFVPTKMIQTKVAYVCAQQAAYQYLIPRKRTPQPTQEKKTTCVSEQSNLHTERGRFYDRRKGCRMPWKESHRDGLLHHPPVANEMFLVTS